MPIKTQTQVSTGFSLFLLSSCATQEWEPERYLRTQGAVPDSHSRFVVCNLAGCKETISIHLDDNDWRTIRKLFKPPATDGETERQRIARAIALMEQLTGEQAGTHDDQPAGRGVFRGTRQLDCVAESTNTTVYLLVMKKKGLLQWHRVGYPEHRGLFNLQAPHNTAVLIEIATNSRFAVDSYYHANGVAPEIVPLRDWHDGHKPEEP